MTRRNRHIGRWSGEARRFDGIIDDVGTGFVERRFDGLEAIPAANSHPNPRIHLAIDQ